MTKITHPLQAALWAGLFSAVAIAPAFAGFSVNGGTSLTGVVTGTATGNDTVAGSGTFVGAYVQNSANTSGKPTINIAAGSSITNPGTQGWFANTTLNTDIYYHQGLVEFNQGTFTNLGTISCTHTGLTAGATEVTLDTFIHAMPTGSNRSYYSGDGVLAWDYNAGSNGTTTIINGSSTNATAAITSVVTSNANVIANGIYAFARYGSSSSTNIYIHNYGKVKGEAQNVNSTATGINAYCNYGGLVINNNNPGGTATAIARYYTTGINGYTNFGNVTAANYGSVVATSSGDSSGISYAVGEDLFSYSGNASFRTTGSVSATSAGTGVNTAYGFFGWAQGVSGTGGKMDLYNSGTITATSSSTGDAKAVYCGGNGGDVTVTNNGTISGVGGSGGGWGLGLEEDTGKTMTITNNGTIKHNNGLGLFLYDTYGGTANITHNAGALIYGGNEGIAGESYKGKITIDCYGDVTTSSSANNAMSLGANDDTVRVYGLPTITGTMNGRAGTNSLVFQLTGTLQTVNGVAATSGGALSSYTLGTSGTIVVSGKTYKWANFNVTGTVTP